MAKKKIIKRNKASPRRPETIAPRRSKTKAKRAPLMTNTELTHIDPRGQARMVDVSAKNQTERLAIADLLHVPQPAGDAAVAVGVEGVERERYPSVRAGVDFRFVEDGVKRPVHDLWRGPGVGVDEERVCVGFVLALNIAIAQGQLE